MYGNKNSSEKVPKAERLSTRHNRAYSPHDDTVMQSEFDNIHPRFRSTPMRVAVASRPDEHEFKIADSDNGGGSVQQKIPPSQLQQQQQQKQGPVLLNRYGQPLPLDPAVAKEITAGRKPGEAVNHNRRQFEHQVHVGLDKPSLTFSSIGGGRTAAPTEIAFGRNRGLKALGEQEPKEFTYREEDFQPLATEDNTERRLSTKSLGSQMPDPKQRLPIDKPDEPTDGSKTEPQHTPAGYFGLSPSFFQRQPTGVSHQPQPEQQSPQHRKTEQLRDHQAKHLERQYRHEYQRDQSPQYDLGVLYPDQGDRAGSSLRRGQPMGQPTYLAPSHHGLAASRTHGSKDRSVTPEMNLGLLYPEEEEQAAYKRTTPAQSHPLLWEPVPTHPSIAATRATRAQDRSITPEMNLGELFPEKVEQSAYKSQSGPSHQQMRHTPISARLGHIQADRHTQGRSVTPEMNLGKLYPEEEEMQAYKAPSRTPYHKQQKSKAAISRRATSPDRSATPEMNLGKVFPESVERAAYVPIQARHAGVHALHRSDRSATPEMNLGAIYPEDEERAAYTKATPRSHVHPKATTASQLDRSATPEMNLGSLFPNKVEEAAYKAKPLTQARQQPSSHPRHAALGPREQDRSGTPEMSLGSVFPEEIEEEAYHRGPSTRAKGRQPALERIRLFKAIDRTATPEMNLGNIFPEKVEKQAYHRGPSKRAQGLKASKAIDRTATPEMNLGNLFPEEVEQEAYHRGPPQRSQGRQPALERVRPSKVIDRTATPEMNLGNVFPEDVEEEAYHRGPSQRSQGRQPALERVRPSKVIDRTATPEMNLGNVFPEEVEQEAYHRGPSQRSQGRQPALERVRPSKVIDRTATPEMNLGNVFPEEVEQEAYHRGPSQRSQGRQPALERVRPSKVIDRTATPEMNLGNVFPEEVERKAYHRGPSQRSQGRQPALERVRPSKAIDRTATPEMNLGNVFPEEVEQEAYHRGPSQRSQGRQPALERVRPSKVIDRTATPEMNLGNVFPEDVEEEAYHQGPSMQAHGRHSAIERVRPSKAIDRSATPEMNLGSIYLEEVEKKAYQGRPSTRKGRHLALDKVQPSKSIDRSATPEMNLRQVFPEEVEQQAYRQGPSTKTKGHQPVLERIRPYKAVDRSATPEMNLGNIFPEDVERKAYHQGLSKQTQGRQPTRERIRPSKTIDRTATPEMNLGNIFPEMVEQEAYRRGPSQRAPDRKPALERVRPSKVIDRTATPEMNLGNVFPEEVEQEAYHRGPSQRSQRSQRSQGRHSAVERVRPLKAIDRSATPEMNLGSVFPEEVEQQAYRQGPSTKTKGHQPVLERIRPYKAVDRSATPEMNLGNVFPEDVERKAYHQGLSKQTQGRQPTRERIRPFNTIDRTATPEMNLGNLFPEEVEQEAYHRGPSQRSQGRRSALERVRPSKAIDRTATPEMNLGNVFPEDVEEEAYHRGPSQRSQGRQPALERVRPSKVIDRTATPEMNLGNVFPEEVEQEAYHRGPSQRSQGRQPALERVRPSKAIDRTATPEMNLGNVFPEEVEQEAYHRGPSQRSQGRQPALERVRPSKVIDRTATPEMNLGNVFPEDVEEEAYHRGPSMQAQGRHSAVERVRPSKAIDRSATPEMNLGSIFPEKVEQEAYKHDRSTRERSQQQTWSNFAPHITGPASWLHAALNPIIRQTQDETHGTNLGSLFPESEQGMSASYFWIPQPTSEDHVDDSMSIPGAFPSEKTQLREDKRKEEVRTPEMNLASLFNEDEVATPEKQQIQSSRSSQDKEPAHPGSSSQPRQNNTPGVGIAGLGVGLGAAGIAGSRAAHDKSREMPMAGGHLGLSSRFFQNNGSEGRAHGTAIHPSAMPPIHHEAPAHHSDPRNYETGLGFQPTSMGSLSRQDLQQQPFSTSGSMGRPQATAAHPTPMGVPVTTQRQPSSSSFSQLPATMPATRKTWYGGEVPIKPKKSPARKALGLGFGFKELKKANKAARSAPVAAGGSSQTPAAPEAPEAPEQYSASRRPLSEQTLAQKISGSPASAFPGLAQGAVRPPIPGTGSQSDLQSAPQPASKPASEPTRALEQDWMSIPAQSPAMTQPRDHVKRLSKRERKAAKKEEIVKQQSVLENISTALIGRRKYSVSTPVMQLNEVFVEPTDDPQEKDLSTTPENNTETIAAGLRSFLGSFHMPTLIPKQPEIAHPMKHDDIGAASSSAYGNTTRDNHTGEHVLSKAATLKKPKLDLSLYPEEQADYPRGDQTGSHDYMPPHVDHARNIRETSTFAQPGASGSFMGTSAGHTPTSAKVAAATLATAATPLLSSSAGQRSMPHQPLAHARPQSQIHSTSGMGNIAQASHGQPQSTSATLKKPKVDLTLFPEEQADYPTGSNRGGHANRVRSADHVRDIKEVDTATMPQTALGGSSAAKPLTAAAVLAIPTAAATLAMTGKPEIHNWMQGAQDSYPLEHSSNSVTLKKPKKKMDPSLFPEEQEDYPRGDVIDRQDKFDDTTPFYDYIDHVRDIKEIPSQTVPDIHHSSRSANTPAGTTAALVGVPLATLAGATMAPMRSMDKPHSTSATLKQYKRAFDPSLFPEEQEDYPRGDVIDRQNKFDDTTPFYDYIDHVRDIKEIPSQTVPDIHRSSRSANTPAGTTAAMVGVPLATLAGSTMAPMRSMDKPHSTSATLKQYKRAFDPSLFPEEQEDYPRGDVIDRQNKFDDTTPFYDYIDHVRDIKEIPSQTVPDIHHSSRSANTPAGTTAALVGVPLATLAGATMAPMRSIDKPHSTSATLKQYKRAFDPSLFPEEQEDYPRGDVIDRQNKFDDTTPFYDYIDHVRDIKEIPSQTVPDIYRSSRSANTPAGTIAAMVGVPLATLAGSTMAPMRSMDKPHSTSATLKQYKRAFDPSLFPEEQEDYPRGDVIDRQNKFDDTTPFYDYIDHVRDIKEVPLQTSRSKIVAGIPIATAAATTAAVMEPPLLHRVPDQSSTQAGGSTMSRGLHGRHPSASATLKRPMTKIDPSLFSEEQADYPRDDAWNKETDKAPLYEYIDHVKDITEVKAIPLHTSKQMNVAAIAVPAAMASGPLHHMVLDLHSHHDQPIVGQSASKLHSVSGAESAPMYQHSRGHSTAGALWRPKYSYFLFPEEEADYPRDDVYDPQANAPFRVRLPTRDIKEVQLDSAHRRPHHDLHPSLAESAAAAFRSMFGGLASHAEEAIAATAVAATMATTARYHVPEAPATERGQGSTVPDPTTLKFPESHEVDPHSYKDLELDLTLSAPQDYPSPAMTAKSDLPMKDLSREAGASQKREQVSGAPWTASSTVDPLPADQMHPGIVPVYVEPAVRVEVPAPMTMHRSGHDLAQGAAAGATLAGIGAMGAHALTVDKTAKEASRRHFRPSEHHSRMMVIHCITDDPEEYLLSADELHSPVVSSTLPLSAMALPTDTSIILNRKYESLSVLPKTPDLAKGSMVAHPMSSGHTVPAAKVALPLGAAAVTAAAFGSHRDRSELASTPRSQNRISIAQPPPELLAASKSTRPGARMPLSGTSSRPLSEAIRSAAPLMGAAAGSVKPDSVVLMESEPASNHDNELHLVGIGAGPDQHLGYMGDHARQWQPHLPQSQVGSQGRPKPATVPDTQAIKGLEEPHVSKVIPLAAAAGIAVPTLVAAPRAAQPAIQPASDDASTGTISHAVDIQPLAIHSKDPIVVSKVTPSEPKEDPTGTQETMHGPLKQDHEHDEDNRHQQPHLTNVAAPPLPIHHQHSPDDHSVHLSNVAAPRFPIEHHHHHPGDPSVHLTNVAAPRVRRPSEEPHSAQQHHQQEAPLYSAEKQSHSLPQSAVPAAALMGATTAMIPAMIAGQSRQSIDEQPKLPELGHDSHPLQGPTDTARIQMPRDQLHSETEGGISLPQTLPSARPEGGVKAFGASVPTATTLPLAGVPATERDIAMTAPPTDTGLTMPLPLTQAETEVKNKDSGSTMSSNSSTFKPIVPVLGAASAATLASSVHDKAHREPLSTLASAPSESQTSHFEAPSVSSAPAPVPIPSGRPISMEYTGEPKLTTASMDMSTMPAGTLGLHHDTDSSVGPHRDDPIPAQRPATVSAPGLASVSHTAVTSTLPKTEEGMSGPGSKTEIYPEEIKSSRPAATAAAIGTALPIATAAAVSGTRSQNHETQDRPQVQSAARDPFVVMPPRVDETRALSQPYLQPQATALPLSQRAIPAPPEGYSGPMPQLNEGETVIWVKKVYTTEEFYDPEDDDGRQLDAYGNRLDRDVSLHLPHRQQQSGTRHGPSQ